VVHHADCFAVPGPGDLTRAALARPGAEACTLCGADQLNPAPQDRAG
jgi:hypothetical protein